MTDEMLALIFKDHLNNHIVILSASEGSPISRAELQGLRFFAIAQNDEV